jgi:hypothetical protein
VSALRARAEEYLAMRRALGFRLTTQGRHLMSFVRFCEDRSAAQVSTDLAVEWATRTSRGSGDEVYQARRLDVVRIFARTCRWRASQIPDRGPNKVLPEWRGMSAGETAEIQPRVQS